MKRSTISGVSRAAATTGLLPILAILLAAPAGSTTIHVPGEQRSIAAGIAAAGPGDTVLVACGTYAEHDLLIDKAVCVRSATGAPDCVTIDAGRLGRGLHFAAGSDDARLEGVTVTGGLAVGSGFDSEGGGIYCRDASPRIADCLITVNEAEAAGSGICCRSASPEIVRCDLVDNLQTIDGGGIYCTHSSPTLDHCTFLANEALFWGGAIFCTFSSPSISHCTLARNAAHWGGGFWCVAECFPLIENSIIASSAEGEGIYVYDNPSVPSAPSVVCCDVHGNAGGEYGGAIEDQTGLHGNISGPPLFCDLEAGDLHLAAVSPCLPEHNDCGVQMGARGRGCDWPTAMMPAPAPVTMLHTWSSPNPFNPSTTVFFTLPRAMPVALRIYDAQGRVVRRLLGGEPRAAGRAHIAWDGRDDGGERVASGAYFYRLEAGDRVRTRKLTMVR
ncbi:MAG: FlgD immunoglobulin-like domain containing protein [Candidatus Eiseniibacteriota bacterium]